MSPLPPPSWSQGVPTLHLWFFGGYFTPQPTLFPGQAIATAWSFQGSSDIGTNLGLRVLLDGALLYTPSPLPFTGDTGQQSMSIPPPTDPTLAKSLYTPGLKKLALEITGNGQHPGPYLVNAAIETKPETLDNTWWSFGGSPSSADWKSDYAIVGSLSDMGHGAALSGGTITLLEAEAGSTGPALARGTVASPALSAGATSGLLSFPVINQDWRWFDSLLMVPVAPTFKSFLYSVAVSVQDQFGNQNMATIGSQSVFVSVSNDKNWAAAGAMGAAAAAVVTLIAAGLAAVGIVTAWAAPELFAVAAGLYTVAQSLAAEANDPPEPDPRFRERVIPAPIEFPMIEIRSDLSATLKALLETCARVIADHSALNETVGRLMGARLAEDREGIDIQLASYRELQQEAGANGRDLPALVERAVKAITETGQLEPEPLRRAMAEWQHSGVPDDIRSAWREAGLAPDALEGLDATLRQVPWAESFGSFEGAVSIMSEALGRLAAFDAEARPPE